MDYGRIKPKPIPNDRPVIGQDIVDLAEAFNMTSLDSSFHFGVFMPTYSQMTQRNLTAKDEESGHQEPAAQRPISDATKALMARLLSRHPEQCLLPQGASPHEVFETIQRTPGYEDFKARHFGPLVGRETGSAYRWNQGNGIHPPVARYLTIIMNMLTQLNAADRAAVLEELKEIAETEAIARGLTPEALWDHGAWK